MQTILVVVDEFEAAAVVLLVVVVVVGTWRNFWLLLLLSASLSSSITSSITSLFHSFLIVDNIWTVRIDRWCNFANNIMVVWFLLQVYSTRSRQTTVLLQCSWFVSKQRSQSHWTSRCKYVFCGLDGLLVCLWEIRLLSIFENLFFFLIVGFVCFSENLLMVEEIRHTFYTAWQKCQQWT